MTDKEKIRIITDFGKAVYGKRHLPEVFDSIASFVRKLLLCDRCSLYLNDPEKQELWTIVAHGLDDKVVVPYGKGIVGLSAMQKRIIVVDDAYSYPHFSDLYDKRHNYETKTVLAVPVINKRGQILGVVQAINKLDDEAYFSKQEGELILLIAAYMSVVIENAKANEEMELQLRERTLELAQLNATLKSRVKSALDEISQKDKLLFMQERKAAMGEMISVIAHQWRQPLSVINLLTSIVENEIEQEPVDRKKCIKNLDELFQINKFLNKTIDDFRNFFNPNKKKEYVSLKEILEAALRIIEKQLEVNRIECVKEIDTQRPIPVFKNELVQVVLNILKNAQDALLEKQAQKPKITIRVFESGESQIMEIEDNAGGIPEESMEELFTHYYTTRDEQKGTGLGLYIARVVVEEHSGGRLNAHNINDGACFKIALPVR